jgi:hypothetical protein
MINYTNINNNVNINNNTPIDDTINTHIKRRRKRRRRRLPRNRNRHDHIFINDNNILNNDEIELNNINLNQRNTLFDWYNKCELIYNKCIYHHNNNKYITKEYIKDTILNELTDTTKASIPFKLLINTIKIFNLKLHKNNINITNFKDKYMNLFNNKNIFISKKIISKNGFYKCYLGEIVFNSYKFESNTSYLLNFNKKENKFFLIKYPLKKSNVVLKNKVLNNKILDNKVLDNKVLDNTVLDYKVLDNKVLDNKVLDNKVLDNIVLDNIVSDNIISDNKALSKKWSEKVVTDTEMDFSIPLNIYVNL